MAQYNIRNFDMAQSLFEELRLRDPYRTEVHLQFCVNIINRALFCCPACSKAPSVHAVVARF